MTPEQHEIDALVVMLSRQVRDGDTVVVGVGTPLALTALLLARRLRALQVRILLPGALNPSSARLADYFDPIGDLGAEFRLGRMDILNAIQRRSVDLQFIRPAQIDQFLRINTEIVTVRGQRRHLVGSIALPDIMALMDRVVAYVTDHSPRTFPTFVDHVTAPRLPDDGIASVVTPLGLLSAPSGDAVLVPRQGVVAETVSERTGFPVWLADDRVGEPTNAELAALAAIDPHRLRDLEASEARPAALAQVEKIMAASSRDPQHALAID